MPDQTRPSPTPGERGYMCVPRWNAPNQIEAVAAVFRSHGVTDDAFLAAVHALHALDLATPGHSYPPEALVRETDVPGTPVLPGIDQRPTENGPSNTDTESAR